MTDPKKHPEAVRLGRKGGNAKAAKTTGFPAMGCIVPPPIPDEPREEVAVPDPEYQPTANASLAAVRGALRAAWHAHWRR